MTQRKAHTSKSTFSDASSDKVLTQYGANRSRSQVNQESAIVASGSKLALRSAGRIGSLWRGLDGVWRDSSDKPINITQKMHSGRFFNLLEPDPSSIIAEDLALGLSRECRWNGQTKGEFGYSVAQHSIAMVRLIERTSKGVDRNLLRYALLHDAEEGLGIKDTITGLKHVLGETYLEIANSISEAIHLRFALAYPAPEKFQKLIKITDAKLGMTEAIHLMGFTAKDYRRRVKNFRLQAVSDVGFVNEYVFPWPPIEAQKRFISEIERLWGAGK